MERREEVKIKSGAEFDHLFPKAMLMTITKKEGATVADTIRFIPQVVRETLFHTDKIAKQLKRNTVYETCKAIWQFVYDHIAYRKDEDGKEQIRSPARAWHDRKYGVDCDCYTVFISSILSNLKIRHILRITKYKEDHFQHIYPIVPLSDGSYITIDCVVRHFDYEETYSEKKDTKMDLEYLNGVNDSSNKNIDAVELIGIYDDREAMAELGRLFKRKGGEPKQKSGGFKQIFKKGAIKEAYKKGGIKAIAKMGFHITNRLNPATVLIRNGILIALKTNMFKIAQRLRYAYLSNEEAQKRGIDMGKFERLKKVKDKLQGIFYGAGGIPENFQKAILTGRGNRDKQVSGLGYIADDMSGLDKYSSTEELLGSDIYQSEELSQLNGLGEPYSAAASVTAATTILTAIAGLLKGIGNILPKKDKGAKDFEESGGEGGASESGGGGGENGGDTSSSSGESGGSADMNFDSGSSNSNSKPMVLKKSNTPSQNEDAGSGGDDSGGGDSSGSANKSANRETSSGGDDPKPEGFWDKNKKWIKPVGIGVGALGLLYAGYRMVTGGKKQTAKPALSGIPKSKKKKRKGGKRTAVKSKKQKKQAVELL
ncbi:MAG: hypothetical protein LCH32_01125 [Bacteroidetes bacterium]|nr:hypothetical protein [Bacteroidota bacterium]